VSHAGGGIGSISEIPVEEEDRKKRSLLQGLVILLVGVTVVATLTVDAGRLDAAWRNLLNSYYSIVRMELPCLRGKDINTAGDGLTNAQRAEG
jgi:hypothetical protein